MDTTKPLSSTLSFRSCKTFYYPNARPQASITCGNHLCAQDGKRLLSLFVEFRRGGQAAQQIVKKKGFASGASRAVARNSDTERGVNTKIRSSAQVYSINHALFLHGRRQQAGIPFGSRYALQNNDQGRASFVAAGS